MEKKINSGEAEEPDGSLPGWQHPPVLSQELTGQQGKFQFVPSRRVVAVIKMRPSIWSAAALLLSATHLA
jgi:hypothetical protein